MRFLFRLDLSLHAGVGKKIGILIFGTKHGVRLVLHACIRLSVKKKFRVSSKHGPSHHSPTHTHDHGAGENSVRQ